MGKFDLSAFTFTAEEIRNINELIMEQLLEAPELEALHTIYPGIVTGKRIGFIGDGGLVGIQAQDCDPVPQQWNVQTTEKIWQPKRWEVFLTECWKDLESTMAIYSLNKGVGVGDLTNTDYMAIVVDVLSKAIKKMIWRFVWFGDTDAANVSAGGVITDSIGTQYFDLIDGLWKQLLALAPDGSMQNINITANTLTTTEQQFKAFKGNTAYELLQSMHNRANVVLRSNPDSIFACTQSVFDGYSAYLEGKESQATYNNLVDGVRTLYFRSIPVVAFPIWDEMIYKYQNNGTTLNSPHRCLLTTKSNLAIGVAGTDVLSEVDVWYEKKDDRNYMRSRDSIDAKVLQDDLFILGI